MIDRRMFVLGTLSAGMLVAGCLPGEPPPGAITVSARGGSGMNPGPDGADRPVTLQILQLRGSGAFDGADFYALQNPAQALGGDLLKVDQIALAPGGSAQRTVGLEPGAAFIAVVAGYRDPTGKVFRVRRPVAPNEISTMSISVGPRGVAIG